MCNYKNIVFRIQCFCVKNFHIKSSGIRVILSPYPQHTLVLDLDSPVIIQGFPQQSMLS